MAYSHGTKWTDELIKERVTEVVDNLELGRMPSQSECEKYYRNTALSNAITRRMGWYTLAEDMGLPIKDSETYFGKRLEALAQEQLISLGYEVRRMPQNFPYDLLVNDATKIDVKASRLYRGAGGNFYTFNIEKPYCTCDIYVLYLLGDDSKEKDVLIIPSKIVSTITQISVGEKTSKYYRFSGRWDFIEQYNAFFDSVS